MIESLLQQTTIPLLEQVTEFGQRRHQVLAGNIANIDTPGYKTRDLPMQDFEKAVQQAVQARRDNFKPAPGWQPNFPVDIHDPNFSFGNAQQLQAGMSPDMLPNQTRSAPAQIAELFPASLHKAETTTPRNLTFQDGGNRSIELESMEMSKNASMQSFAIEVMVAQMRMLEAVISERVT